MVTENFFPWQYLADLPLVSYDGADLSVSDSGITNVNFSVATFLSCLFPDTTGRKNLTTIDEAIKFYAGELDDEDEDDDENIKFIK